MLHLLRQMARLARYFPISAFGWILVAALFAVLPAQAQVSPGATKEEVLKVLGWPKSTSRTDEREILNYPECTVLMKDGQVEKLVFKTPEKRLRLWEQLNPPPSPVPPVTTSPPASVAASVASPVVAPVTTPVVAPVVAQPVPQPLPPAEPPLPPAAPPVVVKPTPVPVPAPAPIVDEPKPEPWIGFAKTAIGVVLLIVVALTIFLFAVGDGSRWRGKKGDLP